MTDFEKKMFDMVRLELNDSLIPKKFKDGKVAHPLYGHCHHASLALYDLLGGKDKGYRLQKAIDELEITHYWLENASGEIIDPTKEQYLDLQRELPYKNKTQRGISYLRPRATKIIIKNILGN